MNSKLEKAGLKGCFNDTGVSSTNCDVESAWNYNISEMNIGKNYLITTEWSGDVVSAFVHSKNSYLVRGGDYAAKEVRAWRHLPEGAPDPLHCCERGTFYCQSTTDGKMILSHCGEKLAYTEAEVIRCPFCEKECDTVNS